jgi:TRAP-type C4-dicarboxylate transport system substrate-binding protein
MIRKLTAAMLAASFVTVGTAGIAEAKSTVKLATLAPARSPWGKVFTAWAEAVAKRTNNEVEVVWLWNGVAGPEENVVGKIRSGQITGAAVTAVGLSAIHKPIVALQMPGAFRSWAEMDKARDALKGQFDKAMNAEGFYVSGWGDVGIARTMSRGFAIAVPADVRGKTPAHLRDDIIAPKVYEVIGGVTAKPASVTELLPMLNSGAINVMTTPSLAAEQLQWSSRLDHINTGVVGFGVGASVLSEKELQKLSPEHRKVMEETGDVATKALTGRIRKADDEAFERLQKKMTVHKQTPAERDAWMGVYKKACQRVKSALPGDVLSKIGFC